jgi:hypothetical protein
MDDSFFDALDNLDAPEIAASTDMDASIAATTANTSELSATSPTAMVTPQRPSAVATPTLDRFVIGNNTKSTTGKDVDERSGLTLRTRLLPASQVELLAKEYCFVPLDRVQSSLLSSSMYHGRDTFTIAVVAARSLPKMAKGKAGGKFVVWKLVDLNEASLREPIALFLFGDAYSTWWKESEGSVVCIVNPRAVTDNDARSALKVEVADQLQKLGTAADFGTCTAVRRDGQPCTMYVNSAKSPVCHYHVGTVTKPAARAEAKRKKIDMAERATISARLSATAASQPMALAPAGGAAAERLRLLRERQLAVHAQLAAPVTLRPNELVSTVTPTVHMSGATDSTQTITLSGSMLLDKSRGAAHAVSRMVVPLRHAANFIGSAPTSAAPPPPPPTAAVLLPHTAKRALSQISAPVPNIHPTSTNVTKRAALMREAAAATAATVRERSAATATPTAAVAPAKTSAEIQFQQLEQLKQAQNKLRLVRSANSQAQLRGDRVSVEQLRTHKHGASTAAVSTALPSSVVRAAQLLARRRPTQSVGLPTLTRTASTIVEARDVNAQPDTAATATTPQQLTEEERESLRKAASIHDAAAGATTAQTDAYLDSLTEREKALEMAESLREVTVTAFHCTTCDRLTVTSPTLCNNAGHNVAKLRDVKKRFFRCTRCNEPAISLGAPMPKSACIKCSGESFRGVSLAEFRGQQTVVQSILPTFRLNHDNADELLSGNARKRRWQDKDEDERAAAEDRQ